MSPFYTTLFILCPFDIASCLLELCEEAGWLHAVTGTSSQSLVYWWVTLLVCACKHIAQVPMPFPFGLLGRGGGKRAWSINYKNNVGSEVFCPTVEHNNQWHSGTSGSEAVQVHPVIGPAARGSDVRLTGLLFEGRETYRDISTLLPRQEVSFLKVGLCSHQSLELPLSPATPSSAWDAATTLGSENALPLVRLSAATARLALKDTSQAVRKKNSHTALALQTLLWAEIHCELTKAKWTTCMQLSLSMTTLQNCSYPKQYLQLHHSDIHCSI